MKITTHFALVIGIITVFVIGWLLVTVLDKGMAAVDEVLTTSTEAPR